MTQAKIDLDLEQAETGDFVCRLWVLDPKLIGRSAELELVARVEVHEEGGVHADRVLYSAEIQSLAGKMELPIPKAAVLGVYSYSGDSIDLEIHTRIKVDDGLLFDTKVSETQRLELGLKPTLEEETKLVVEPPDGFHPITNLWAIPFSNRIFATVLVVLAVVLLTAILLIGVHDQFRLDGGAIFFEGRSEGGAPLLNAVLATSMLGAGLWFMLRTQLRQYMRFHVGRLPARVSYGETVRVGDLFRGRSRVPLRVATLRIVACNLECGRRRSGKSTVSFKNPVRGLVLFERRLEDVPAGKRIESYFDVQMSFDPMFDALYPPFRVSKTHGIDVYWEIQLLCPDFVDQELEPRKIFIAEDFW